MSTKVYIDSYLNPGHFLDEILHLSPNGDGKYGEIEGVNTPDEAEYAVFFDSPPNKEVLDKFKPENIFIYSLETPDVSGFTPSQRKFPYKCFDFFTSPDVYTYNRYFVISKSYRELYDESGPPVPKTKQCSVVTSDKYHISGHQLRYNTLLKLYDEYPGLFDVYGKMYNGETLNIHFGDSYKGEIPRNHPYIPCKLPGMESYKYYISFENCRRHNYISEKLWDAYLAWCKPIYYGCPNVLDYFPAESLFVFDKPETLIENFQDIINAPVDYELMRECRIKILTDYNIWNYLNNIVTTGQPVSKQLSGVQ